ncbi:DUF1211 domain-containing protein [Arenibacter sp. N53]|uniref:TMEM175 family protein n=1 Tax=Arenibacter TaxID=178469 RepID=UPI000CD40712|nr:MULTISPECIES: TMEM175 family protein [Arenibacter]MCM4154318.1 DUF1211 domain-containing protein [Arenibacter sp. N53]
MTTNRLEAFSDGVLAIIITIMVLEMKVPEGDTLAALKPLIPTFVTYVLSFINVGIYWNNHHHLMHASNKVNGKVLWANLYLLFWLSLFPFATGYMGENHFQELPTALYGFVLFMASIAWYILVLTLKSNHPKHTMLHTTYKSKNKGTFSIVLFGLATIFGFVQPIISVGIYVLVAIIWFVPNKDLEKEV